MDDLGNRDGNQTLRGDGTVHFAVDPLTNRYTAIAGHPLAYDVAGNLTQDKDGYQFTYDYENRITRIYEDNNSDGSYNSGDTNIAEYAYDTQGRRIRVYDAVADATTLYYYSDNWQVLAEYNGSGVQQAYYIFGNYIDEVLLMNRGGSDKYYLHDHLYSPAALLDNSGNVIERYEYDAYGKVTVWNAAFTTTYTTSQYGNPFYFTGREVDWFDNGNMTLQHNRNRYLSQYMGCWFTPDPLGYVDGLNHNEYALSNPMNLIDPIGLRIVRLVFSYVYKNNNTRLYVPALSRIEEVIKKTLKPCFDNLKCDKVRVICQESKQPPTLVGFVYGGMSKKPIMYLSHIDLSDKEGSATNLGFCSRGSPYCTIFAKRIDNAIRNMPPSEASVRRQNLHIIFANITIHESLWHGMLGLTDDRNAEAGSFGSTAAHYEPMKMTESDCEKLRNRLEVEQNE